MMKTEWIFCPICGRKTHNKIRENAEMKNSPLYCPKCKKETFVNVKYFIVSVCVDSTK